MTARRPRTLGRVAPVAVLLAALAACTHAPRRPEAEESPRPSVSAPAGEEGGEVGLASFYGRKFHGRRTASGERYDMHAMTCAHPRAPFGARLKVTDLENGRSVVVTVTDRGPFKRGRVVDLSLAAARKLGIVDRGLARVRVEAVED
ncbi:septal ring lytic transglycosylase RlpA family protein [Anaeromyxobacter terrae]|uniref:septal ring lytic transglycosylase RlpA family protein n=1 Tax=Anaeromyxobacter terrae TaxID=2925406 RepID=UPI001F581ACE|nr:septal ring lytic transglycosylase RlpA family protein [Anaeromyxobacter sp. SG22]